MTYGMLKTANKFNHTQTTLEAWTNYGGPPSIQGHEDGEASVPPMLELIEQANKRGASGIIIGCADDTGLRRARKIANCPVVGIGQSAYHLAALAGDQFSVVTTLSVSVPILEENIRSYGLANKLAKVRASGVKVLELETDPINAQARVLKEIQKAEKNDSISSVVLGCAGMTNIPTVAPDNLKVILIDGVAAGVQVACALLPKG